jgi:hypothetical protein
MPSAGSACGGFFQLRIEWPARFLGPPPRRWIDLSAGSRAASPCHPLKPRDGVKMTVTRDDGQSLVPGDGGDPGVVEKQTQEGFRVQGSDGQRHFRKHLACRDQPNRWLRLPFAGKSRTHPPRERQKKVRKSRLMRRILRSAQTASESPSIRPRDRAARRNGTGSQL